MVSPERFARGMTFDQYVAYTATPENLDRARRPPAAPAARLERAPAPDLRRHAAVAGPAGGVDVAGGPAGGTGQGAGDLRGVVVGLPPRHPGDREGRRRRPASSCASSRATASASAPLPSPIRRSRRTPTSWRSSSTGATARPSSRSPSSCSTRATCGQLYRYIEFPAVYHKDRIVGAARAARPGETAEQTRERGEPRVHGHAGARRSSTSGASAAVAEWISMLYERARVGSLGVSRADRAGGVSP